MTDAEIIELISEEIKKRGITWLDMIGGRYVSYDKDHKRIVRDNVFKSKDWSHRLIELISEGDYDPKAKKYLLKISLQDLVRFWWENIVCQEDLIADIFEDIYIHFKDKMAPEKKEEPRPEYDLDFSEIIMNKKVA